MLRPVGVISRPSRPMAAMPPSRFLQAFSSGYNTMDALASLAFGIIVVQVIRDLGVAGAGGYRSQHRPRGHLQLPVHGA